MQLLRSSAVEQMYLEEVLNEAIQEPLLTLSDRTEQVLSERENRHSGPTIIHLVK